MIYIVQMLAVVALVTAVSADPTGAPARHYQAHIRYDVPDGCPDEKAYIQILRQRMPAFHPELAPGEWPTLEVSVRANREGGAMVGELRLVAREKRSSQRVVAASSCDEVVSALAFIGAMTLEQERRETATASQNEAREEAMAPASRASDLAGNSWSYTLGLGAEGGPAESGVEVTPLAMGPHAWIQFVRERSPWRAAVFGFGAAYRLSGNMRTPDGDARFAWAILQIEGCPTSIMQGPWSFQPCVGFESGILHGRGIGVGSSGSADRAWAAPRIVVRGRWLSKSWFGMAVEIGGETPLIRDKFVFDPPRTLVYQPPAFLMFAGLAAIVQF